MLTVGDALGLAVFSGAHCVAGAAGLGRVVEWVHNVGVPDAANWLNGGELVLTTYINMPQDADAQANYLNAMVDKGVAALGIAVGRYIDRIPQPLCDIAEARRFPLITVPFQLLFVDIARTINQAIAQRDLRAALDIHQRLTRLVMQEAGLTELTVTLATLVQQSVSIENDRFEAYANHNLAPVDEARRYTQQQGRTDPRLVAALESRGYLPEIRRTLRPIMLPKMPDVGLEMERILAPIVLNGEVYGYLWIIADGSPLTELERMAVESGSTVAALMLLREERAQRAAVEERTELVTRLLSPRAIEREDVYADRAARWGLNLRAPYRVVVVNGARPPLNPLLARTERWLHAAALHGLAGVSADQVVLLVEDSRGLMDAVQQWIDQIGPERDEVRAAISSAGRGVAWAAHGLVDAQDALILGARLADASVVLTCDDLSFPLTLYRAGPAALDSNPHVPALRRLRAETGADLFHTLHVYLEQGGSGVAAADSLHIHRSTLNYRLGRIAEVAGMDLSDPRQRLALHTAIVLMLLFDPATLPDA